MTEPFDSIPPETETPTASTPQRQQRPHRARDLTPVAPAVTAQARAARQGHRGAVVWLTGLSGSGKTTIAQAAERRLFAAGWNAFVLDGDGLRAGLNADLGFSSDDRAENIRRAGEVAALLADSGQVVLAAFISPYAADRARARQASRQPFLEVHVRASLATCERRDVKGLYRRARAGTLPGFTGIGAPYETPLAPDLVLDTEIEPPERSAERLILLIRALCALPSP